MPELTPTQRALAQLHGIAVEYVDWWGQLVPVPTATVLAVLAALGVEAADPESAASAWQAAQHRLEVEALPACVVTRQDQPVEVTLRHLSGETAEAWVELETGRRLDVSVAPAIPPLDSPRRWKDESHITLPARIPLGYHLLRARWPGGDAVTSLIVTPAFLGLPERLGDDRAWGLATQLYSVRSRDSWGIGDLADLRDGGGWSGPSSAQTSCWSTRCRPPSRSRPMEPSPYLPSSRAYVNPVYLRVEQITEYADLPPVAREQVEALEHDVHADARRPRRDRPRPELGGEARGAAHRSRGAATGGAGAGLPGIPRPRRRCTSRLRHLVRARRGVRRGLARLARRAAPPRPAPGQGVPRPATPTGIDFYSWLQWVLDEQLADAQQAATDAGMRLGVMHDLAVGVHPRRCGRLGAAGRPRPGHHRRCSTGRLQPARAGLEPATRGGRIAWRRSGTRRSGT